MYRKVEDTPSQPEDFEFPLLGKLSHDNRWVVMASLVPWTEFEQEYALNFAEDIGAPALPFRMALGALIIKEKLGISDRETVEQIKENPYLQYFIGRREYSNEAPFDASLLVKFRERITASLVNEVNEDERIRNRIEGKFGTSKRRYGLNRVMAKLPHTSETVIAITFLVINLETLLRQVFCVFLSYFFSNHTFLAANINYDYDWTFFKKNSSSLFQA